MSLYGLTKTDVSRLSKLLRAFEQGELRTKSTDKRTLLPPIETRVAKTQEEIPARNGDTAGKGSVKFFKIDGDELTETSVAETDVYNISEVDFPADVFVYLVRDPVSGKMILGGCCFSNDGFGSGDISGDGSGDDNGSGDDSGNDDDGDGDGGGSGGDGSGTDPDDCIPMCSVGVGGTCPDGYTKVYMYVTACEDGSGSGSGSGGKSHKICMCMLDSQLHDEDQDCCSDSAGSGNDSGSGDGTGNGSGIGGINPCEGANAVGGLQGPEENKCCGCLGGFENGDIADVSFGGVIDDAALVWDSSTDFTLIRTCGSNTLKFEFTCRDDGYALIITERSGITFIADVLVYYASTDSATDADWDTVNCRPFLWQADDVPLGELPCLGLDPGETATVTVTLR